MKRMKQGLFSLMISSILWWPGVGQAETLIHWAYITNGGSGARVERASRRAIAVETVQPGQYVVTFPRNVRNVGCTGTPNSSGGLVTCVPGDVAGLAENQVSVVTIDAFGSGLIIFDFTVVVYSEVPER